MFSDPLDCDVFLSLRFSFLILQIVMCSDLTDRNVLQRMVLSLLLQRLQACWSNGDHDIQVKPMVMIMNAMMSLPLLLLSYCISYWTQNAGSRSYALWHHLLHLPHGFWSGVSLFTKGFSQTNSVLLPRLTTSSSWVTQWVWSLLSIKYQRKKIMPKSLV